MSEAHGLWLGIRQEISHLRSSSRKTAFSIKGDLLTTIRQPSTRLLRLAEFHAHARFKTSRNAWILQILLDGLEELGRFGAIDDAVIGRKDEIHPLASDDCAVLEADALFDARHGQDGSLRRIDDGGKSVTPNIPILEMVKDPPLYSSGLSLPSLARVASSFISTEISPRFLIIGMADDRSDQSPFDRDGD